MAAYDLPLGAAEGSRVLGRLQPLLSHPHTAMIVRALIVLGAGAAGIYLMIPRGQRAGRRLERYLGAALAALSLILLATAPISSGTSEGGESHRTLLWPLDDKLACYTFHLLAAVSLISAVMMITSRNPVYSALWFAMVLLGNSGLYLLQGAEFLSLSTIIVYAGAIVVTFLFVIMLAQPAGTARYDRTSREPLLSGVTGLILASALAGTVHYAMQVEGQGRTGTGSTRPDPALVAHAAAAEGPYTKIDPERHVAGLGKVLFVDHIVSVEIIGVLLLAAVVGAVLIAGHPIAEHGAGRGAHEE